MTKFEPEVAYRILKARQDRLLAEAERIGPNSWTGWGVATFEEYMGWREFMSGFSEAVFMEDVLDYLRERIEEEKSNAVH